MYHFPGRKDKNVFSTRNYFFSLFGSLKQNLAGKTLGYFFTEIEQLVF